MRLEGSDGYSLDLSITGYQFPPMSTGVLGFDHDANWLMVQGYATDGVRGWSFRDPCLLTTEANELVGWLEAVSAGRPDVDTTDFTEPNLEFRRVSVAGEAPIVRVTFRLQSLPPWSKEVTDDDWDGLWLEFRLSQEALATAADHLRNELARYPRR